MTFAVETESTEGININTVGIVLNDRRRGRLITSSRSSAARRGDRVVEIRSTSL